MKIELEELLNKNLKEGVNLFLGTGFSIYSKDLQGQRLPLGLKLYQELIHEFEYPPINDLGKTVNLSRYKFKELQNF